MNQIIVMGATKFRVDLRNMLERVHSGRGPVVVTLYGEETAVLLGIREWRRLQDATALEKQKESVANE